MDLAPSSPDAIGRGILIGHASQYASGTVMFPEAEEAKRLLKFTSRIVKGGEAVRGSIEPWGENWLLWLRRWRRQTPIRRNEKQEVYKPGKRAYPDQ